MENEDNKIIEQKNDNNKEDIILEENNINDNTNNNNYVSQTDYNDYSTLNIIALIIFIILSFCYPIVGIPCAAIALYCKINNKNAFKMIIKIILTIGIGVLIAFGACALMLSGL